MSGVRKGGKKNNRYTVIFKFANGEKDFERFPDQQGADKHATFAMVHREDIVKAKVQYKRDEFTDAEVVGWFHRKDGAIFYHSVKMDEDYAIT